MMKRTIILVLLSYCGRGIAQDSTSTYKKRVLESTEVDFLTSYYTQDGDNAAVTGGIGTEKLTDFTPTIVIAMPLNTDDVLTVDAGISAYTSASSSNLNPFDGSSSGASSGGGGDDDHDHDGVVTGRQIQASSVTGSPWVASSGASRSDVWGNVSLDYSHSSDDRNGIWNAHAGFSAEFDYTSFGFGGGYARLFNEKNTEISLKGQVYLDTWSPRYPTELDSYIEVNGDLNQGFFQDVPILNRNGTVINKNWPANQIWSPVEGFSLIQDKSRNSYSISLGFSQILSKNAQISLFMDVVQQEGWLSNPMQRVYFKDRENYYIGNSSSIPFYTSPDNTDVFQLADDIERLPNTRTKTPFGMRFNYFINEMLTVRTYYRYYFDNWGMTSHTANIEIPIKLNDRFTVYPTYRYYTQTAIDYFAPYEEHVSTETYYTSDFDLSAFHANQYGFGINYTDIFTKFHIASLGLKSIDVRFNHYERTTGLKATIISGGLKFVLD
ncbi:MAG: DUF3570 domain-containing protein [Flavobacteriaceae bacterium]